MASSIYNQLDRGLAQVTSASQRAIIYRGKIIPCMVLLGDNSTKLEMGGLHDQSIVHVKVRRELVPIGQDGDPHTNERVMYPAIADNGLTPRSYAISIVIPDEFSFAFTLIDPST